MQSLVILVLVSLSFSSAINKHLPSYFPRCYRDRAPEELNACLLKATDTMRPFLQKGIPELKIPSISPLIIPEITLEQGSSSTSYKAYAKNVSLFGLDGYKFKRNDFNTKTLSFSCEVYMPELAMKGTYIVEGKFLNAPLKGQGTFYSNISVIYLCVATNPTLTVTTTHKYVAQLRMCANSNGTLVTESKLVSRKNVQYMEITNMVTKINVGKVQDYGLDGLFTDNEILAKATQNALRENLPLVVEEMKPAIELLMTKLFKDVILNNILKLPYDEVFPISKLK